VPCRRRSLLKRRVSQHSWWQTALRPSRSYLTDRALEHWPLKRQSGEPEPATHGNLDHEHQSAARHCRRTAAQLTGSQLLKLKRQRLAAAERRPSTGGQARHQWSLSNASPSVPRDHEPWLTRCLVFGGNCRRSGDGEHLYCGVCWLTFELSGRQRQDDRARAVKMHRVQQTGHWRPADGAPLERGVMHQPTPRRKVKFPEYSRQTKTSQSS